MHTDKKQTDRKILTANEVKDRLRGLEWIICAALPFLKKLSDVLKGENPTVLLTDKEGCILHIEAAAKIESALSAQLIMKGTFPNQNTIIGRAITLCTSKVSDEPQDSSGEFNIDKGNDQWTCIASSVLNDEKQIEGCLAVCLPYKHANSSVKAMVQMVSNCIGREISLYNDKLRAKKLLDEQTTIFNRHALADLVIDQSGKIELISDKACELLGISRKNAHHKNIAHFIPSWDTSTLTKKGNDEIENIEVEIINTINSGTYLLNAKAVKRTSGVIDEIVCSLRSMKQVLNESNRYIGNVAAFSFDDIPAISAHMKRLVKAAKSIALYDTPAIIFGEKHTGKGMFAQAIHSYGSRSSFGFVQVDLSGLTPNEMDEALWGYTINHKPYKKRLPKPGAFEFADGGTLYINEIGLLPLALQEKLLNTMKTGKTERLEGGKTIKVNVRVIASSTTDLTQSIEDGLFRIDLFYAISNASLRIPPIRERRQEIPLLLSQLACTLAIDMGLTTPEIPKKIMLILKRYEWPNNMMDMREFIKKVILEQDKIFKSYRNERDFKRKNLYLDRLKEIGSLTTIEENEKRLVVKAYETFNGSISKTSRMLGISRNTLYLKLKRYGIDNLDKK